MNIKDALLFAMTLATIGILHRLFGLPFTGEVLTQAMVMAATNVILFAIRERAK